MNDYNNKMHELIEKDINNIINRTHFYSNDIMSYQVQSIIGTALENYRWNRSIYEYLIESDKYPEIHVFIRCRKGEEIDEIKVLRFERLYKLKKLEELNEKSIL